MSARSRLFPAWAATSRGRRRRRRVRRYPLALTHPPAKLTPGPAGTWPLRYDELVQPVLDKQCTACHRPGSGDEQAARFDLTAARSYDNLLAYGNKDLHDLAFESRNRSVAYDFPARKSKLLALLKTDKAHQAVRLEGEASSG